MTLQEAFPGTSLYRKLKAEGRLLEAEAWERCTLFDVNYRPTHMGVEELRQRFHELAAKLYGESFTTYRRERFKRQRQHRPRSRRRLVPLGR